MKLKEQLEETEQQTEAAFRQHLKEASAVVASWEPWERGILGSKRNGSLAVKAGTAQQTGTEQANSAPKNEGNQPTEETNRDR